MQTLNAAAAAGLEAELGSLEVGKRADIVVRSARSSEAYPDNNPVHALALRLRGGSVDTVLVNGEVVFREGHSTRVDELEVYQTVSESVIARANAAWNRTQTRVANCQRIDSTQSVDD